MMGRIGKHLESQRKRANREFLDDKQMTHWQFVTCLAFASMLAACSTVKVPVATGGSKSDATIDMSFEYGPFEKPVIDWGQTATTASKRCEVWGYTGAEAFGGAIETCIQYDRSGDCERARVTTTYQCTGPGTQ